MREKDNFFYGKELDKSVPIPLYFQLKEMIIEAIKGGKCKRGSMIPTEKEFSEMFLISRTTVRQAITELVQEGWLYRIKSKGTFVSRPKIQQDFIQRLETYQEQMERLGMRPRTEVLGLGMVEAEGHIAESLEISEGSKVIYLHRRRFANNEPILLVESYLPYESCSFIMSHNFVEESLYETLKETDDTEVRQIRRRVEAVEAIECDKEYLNMEEGKPVQLFHSIGCNIYGRPIEYSIARYRGDRNSFEVVIIADK